MDTMKKVRPAAPLAPWLGGKKALSAKIIERIEAVDHTTYVEPFVGMGSAFLHCFDEEALEYTLNQMWLIVW